MIKVWDDADDQDGLRDALTVKVTLYANGDAVDDYTDIELEQWRDVLYTLQASDLMGWERSIKRRGIVMPAAIRDELLMLLQEARVQ